jgi:hypothetical protein
VRKIHGMKTVELMAHLRAMHDPREWGFFEELRIGTGRGKDSEQRFDGWAIHFHPSKRNVVRCYEAKVSRSDFYTEINKPMKRRPGMRLSNEFYFVAPLGMLKIEEIPPECGLMEVFEDGHIETTVKAPYRNTIPPTWLFVSAICRRIDRPHYDEFMAYIREMNKIKHYGLIAKRVLDDHIERYRNYQFGSQEVPDQIADALGKAKEDIEDIIRRNLNEIEVDI